MKNKESLSSIIKPLIIKAFRFLENEYYVPEFQIEESSVFIEMVKVQYVNKILRREINIGFTQGRVFEQIVFTFNVSISRIPYSGIEDFYSLSNYLQSLEKDFETNIYGAFDFDSAEEILNKLADSLKTYAWDIVNGNIWLEKYYPRKD